MKIVFKGYAGQGNAQPEENEAMGLVVGRSYAVIDRWECGADCTKGGSPTVLNERGERTDVCHDECEEFQ